MKDLKYKNNRINMIPLIVISLSLAIILVGISHIIPLETETEIISERVEIIGYRNANEHRTDKEYKSIIKYQNRHIEIEGFDLWKYSSTNVGKTIKMSFEITRTKFRNFDKEKFEYLGIAEDRSEEIEKIDVE